MDAKLIERVQLTKDHAAFEQLVKLYQSPIRQFLRRLVQQDQAVADELAQDTFIKAFMHIEGYQHKGKFLSWLFRIAYQEFVSLYRKKGALTNSDFPEVVDDKDWESQVVAERTVKALMIHLRTDERASLMLHFSHGLSHQDIAQVMDVPLGTVKSLIRRSKQKLQTMLEPNKAEETHEQ